MDSKKENEKFSKPVQASSERKIVHNYIIGITAWAFLCIRRNTVSEPRTILPLK